MDDAYIKHYQIIKDELPHYFFWIVALLEGEGTFLKRPLRIECGMNDYEPIFKLASLMGVGVSTYKYGENNIRYRATLGGKRAVALMKLLYPYLCKRRQKQIKRALLFNNISID